MIATCKFNEQSGNLISTICGAVTTGTLWRFLKLEKKTVTIDLNEYLLPPYEPILGRLVQMVMVQGATSTAFANPQNI